MPSQKNIEEVKLLEDKLATSSAFFLADYSNLCVKDQVALRASISAVGGKLKVTKNRLFKIALKKYLGSLPQEIENFLRGPNLILFTTSDPIAPLKALVDFSKKNEAGKPEVKTGVLDKNILSITKIQQLANLPSKEQLIVNLIYTIRAPIANLLNILQAPNRNLVYALNAIKINNNQ